MLVSPLPDFYWRIAVGLVIHGSPTSPRLVLEWIPDASDQGRLAEALLARAQDLMDQGRTPLVAFAVACTELQASEPMFSAVPFPLESIP